MAEKQWTEITGELLKFEAPGDSVQGILVAREHVAGIGNGPANIIYRVDKGGGVIVSFYGSAVLNNRMAGVTIGQEVRIEYLRDEPSTKPGFSDMKLFKVQVR